MAVNGRIVGSDVAGAARNCEDDRGVPFISLMLMFFVLRFSWLFCRLFCASFC